MSPKSLSYMGALRESLNHSNRSVLALFWNNNQPGVMEPGLASKRGNQRQLSQNPIGISVLGRDRSRIHSSEMWARWLVVGGEGDS